MVNNWERVTRIAKPGQPNTTFIRFNLRETGSGNYCCQMDEGFGEQEEDKGKPCIFVRRESRYFKSATLRNNYMVSERHYYEVDTK